MDSKTAITVLESEVRSVRTYIGNLYLSIKCSHNCCKCNHKLCVYHYYNIICLLVDKLELCADKENYNLFEKVLNEHKLYLDLKANGYL
jgi:hypothetical protein